MNKNTNPAVVSLVASMEGLTKSLLTAVVHCNDVVNGIQVILASRQKLLPAAPKLAIALATPVAAPEPVKSTAKAPGKPKAPTLTETVFKATTLLTVAGIVPEVGKVFTWQGKKAKSQWKVLSIAGNIVTVVRA